MSAISTQKIIDLGIQRARMSLLKGQTAGQVVDFASRRKAHEADQDVDPPVEQDVGLWEATVDSEGLHMAPARARALLARAPDPDHPLVDILKQIAAR